MSDLSNHSEKKIVLSLAVVLLVWISTNLQLRLFHKIMLMVKLNVKFEKITKIMIKLVGYNWQSSCPWFIKTCSVLVWQQNALSKSVIANNVILIKNILIIRTPAVLCSYIVLLVIKSVHNLHIHVHVYELYEVELHSN